MLIIFCTNLATNIGDSYIFNKKANIGLAIYSLFLIKFAEYYLFTQSV